MIDVAGKVVVITGASRGIGAGIAAECNSRNMFVGVCARQKPDVPSADNLVSVCADVRSEQAVQALADLVVDKFGTIDMWINNAGVLHPVGPLRDCSSDDVRTHLDINVMGVIHGTKSFIEHVRTRDGEGVLINISSGASSNAYSGWGPYCASKAAVDKITEVAQLEEAESGLRAYSVAPGIVDTDMQTTIRSCDVTQFPMVEKFRELKRDNAFSSVEFVARQLLAIAFDPKQRPQSVCTRLPFGQ